MRPTRTRLRAVNPESHPDGRGRRPYLDLLSKTRQCERRSLKKLPAADTLQCVRRTLAITSTNTRSERVLTRKHPSIPIHQLPERPMSKSFHYSDPPDRHGMFDGVQLCGQAVR